MWRPDVAGGAGRRPDTASAPTGSGGGWDADGEGARAETDEPDADVQVPVADDVADADWDGTSRPPPPPAVQRSGLPRRRRGRSRRREHFRAGASAATRRGRGWPSSVAREDLHAAMRSLASARRRVTCMRVAAAEAETPDVARFLNWRAAKVGALQASATEAGTAARTGVWHGGASGLCKTLSRRAMFERAQHVHGVSDQLDACIRARGDCERFPCTRTFLCLRGRYANLQACTTHVHGFFLDFPCTLNTCRPAQLATVLSQAPMKNKVASVLDKTKFSG